MKANLFYADCLCCAHHHVPKPAMSGRLPRRRNTVLKAHGRLCHTNYKIEAISANLLAISKTHKVVTGAKANLDIYLREMVRAN